MAVVTGRMNEDLSKKIDAIARAMESGEHVDDFLHNLSVVKLRTKQVGESSHDSRTLFRGVWIKYTVEVLSHVVKYGLGDKSEGGRAHMCTNNPVSDRAFRFFLTLCQGNSS